MKSSKKHNGFVIALAWPQTYCKQAGAWYDILMYYLGVNRRGYYKVGHAAIVLVDDDTLSCRYFDFGRYHAPHGHGRVRSADTDHDLRIKTKPVISKNRSDITNLEDILSELYGNSSTHGSGHIYAATSRINFDSSLSFVKQLQEKEYIPYGPFNTAGTNCSRFVSSAILAGKPKLGMKLKLQFPLTVSPTPMWNLLAVGGDIRGHNQRFWKVPELIPDKHLELIS